VWEKRKRKRERQQGKELMRKAEGGRVTGYGYENDGGWEASMS